MSPSDRIKKRQDLPGTALARDARYRNLSDNALIVLADVSVTGEIVWTNQAGLDFVEFDSLEELQKKNIIELWAHPEQRESFLSMLRRDGYVRSYPIDYLTRTGKVVHALGSAILDDDMISMVAIDITSQTKANAENALLLRDLGQRHTELQCIHTVTDTVRPRKCASRRTVRLSWTTAARPRALTPERS